ncbi:MAG: LysR family transcriptional regulator [Gemmatimonadaceae bacterium]|nr:LysR family transcriptional regulator [Gemmatimonadaceae bacterium]
MELQQLRGFCEVARQGSFTRAAGRLFLTQPAVSQQIRALEEELGQRLLERGRKGVRLTAAGEALFRRARSVLGEVAAARAELEEMGTGVRGRVLLATSDTNCTYVLPPVLRRFRERFPEVEVDIRNKMSPEIGQLVLADEIDFGLATLPIRSRGLSAEPVFERGDVWICPAGHPLSRRKAVLPATAGRHPLLALERGSQSRALLDAMLRGARAAPSIAMELGSIEIIKRFVEIGFGVALVPRVSVADEVAAGRLAAVDARGVPRRSVGLVRHRGRPASPAAAALIELIRGELAGLRY